ncbi:MAG TPA: hypothetical protein VN875_04395 [Candidatus Binatus sp.]|jgi:hypothetical protein|nr:hypothetical protein [Candidatus Binatus sp.]
MKIPRGLDAPSLCQSGTVDRLNVDRATALLPAQTKADELFKAVEREELIRSGVSESRISQDIYDLAEKPQLLVRRLPDILTHFSG